MAVKTTLEQLQEVQSAITRVMAGQSVSVGNKQLTYASLKWLTEREAMLLERYRAEQSGSVNPFNKVRFDSPV